MEMCVDMNVCFEERVIRMYFDFYEKTYVNAFLHSRIPAPVISLNSFTCDAVAKVLLRIGLRRSNGRRNVKRDLERDNIFFSCWFVE